MKRAPLVGLLFITMIIGSLLSSCKKQSHTSVSISKLRYQAETIEDLGPPMYLEDYEAYGAQVADDFFIWRNEGNPDFYENCVAYDNGDGITLTLTAPSFSLHDTAQPWGVSVSEVSEELVVTGWVKNLLLEKWENDQWVRQGIIHTDWYGYNTYEAICDLKYQRPMAATPGTNPDTWKEGLTLLSPLTIPVEHVCPRVSAGSYRFVFFISVQNGEQVENRTYHIPFTVTE